MAYKVLASKVPRSTWHLAHYLAEQQGVSVSMFIRNLIEKAEENETDSNRSK